MGRYTIGFLGHFAYGKRICDYMDTLILRALQQHSEVRVMLTLWKEADRLMAGRVLEIGKLFPGLRLVPVVTEQEDASTRKTARASRPASVKGGSTPQTPTRWFPTHSLRTSYPAIIRNSSSAATRSFIRRSGSRCISGKTSHGKSA